MYARERDRDDRKGVGHVVQAHADVFGGLIRERADVDVALELVAQAELDRDLDEFVGALGQVHGEDLRRRRQPLVVVAQQHQEELPLLGHPVAADSFEATGPVLKSVREQADLGIVVALERHSRYRR